MWASPSWESGTRASWGKGWGTCSWDWSKWQGKGKGKGKSRKGLKGKSGGDKWKAIEQLELGLAKALFRIEALESIIEDIHSDLGSEIEEQEETPRDPSHDQDQETSRCSTA